MNMQSSNSEVIVNKDNIKYWRYGGQAIAIEIRLLKIKEYLRDIQNRI